MGNSQRKARTLVRCGVIMAAFAFTTFRGHSLAASDLGAEELTLKMTNFVNGYGGYGDIDSNRIRSFASPQRPSDVVGYPSNSKKDMSSTAACNDVLLYLPDLVGNCGHGCQLNTYILAVLVATFEDKPLVLLEPPPSKHERWPGGSQFGCRRPDNDEADTMNKATMTDRGYTYPRGFSRLVEHPEWLSRGCPVPCASTKSYGDWNTLAGSNTECRPVTCAEVADYTATGGNGYSNIKQTTTKTVLAVGGAALRGKCFPVQQMLQRPSPRRGTKGSAHDWAVRMGASQREAEAFHNTTDPQVIWDYVSGWLVRSGLPKFQPWIARDVADHLKDVSSGLFSPPLVDGGIDRTDKEKGGLGGIWEGGGYDAVHVRRGDKLILESRNNVVKYWEKASKTLPKKRYIPFSHYIRRWIGNNGTVVGCFDDGGQRLATTTRHRRVYVATDDPATVREEIATLTLATAMGVQGGSIQLNASSSSVEEALMTPMTLEVRSTSDTDGKDVCLHLEFFFHPGPDSREYHIHIQDHKKQETCVKKYERNIAAIADLTLLTRSDVFIGEYNSNWGRLVRILRTTLAGTTNDETKLPDVSTKEVFVAWGGEEPPPPGY